MDNHFRSAIVLAVGLLFLAYANFVKAADWLVGPNGKATAQGTKDDPWDIASALAAEHPVEPGDTVWLLKGTYKRPFENGGRGFQVRLAGKEGCPVHVRAEKGERVTIDGGLALDKLVNYLWMWDMEITVSEPLVKGSPGNPAEATSWPNLNRPLGGLNIETGTGCKFINIVSHHNSGGVGFFAGCKDSELYGCLIYDNGWIGRDRGHGHAIYVQNKDGTKIISDCVMSGGCGYTMHAYTEKGFVNNIVYEGNIAYDNPNAFLVGGGKPSHGIVAKNNYLYKAGNLLVAHLNRKNEDCELRDNVIVNGELRIGVCSRIINEGNLVLGEKDERPGGAKIVFRPNKYDSQRANLAIFNWEKKEKVAVDTGDFLKAGDRYRLMDPRDFYGKPVHSGLADGKVIRVPMSTEFAAYVLLKSAG
jgi:hypothetical protein